MAGAADDSAMARKWSGGLLALIQQQEETVIEDVYHSRLFAGHAIFLGTHLSKPITSAKLTLVMGSEDIVVSAPR